jgi:hypothetical protein
LGRLFGAWFSPRGMLVIMDWLGRPTRPRQISRNYPLRTNATTAALASIRSCGTRLVKPTAVSITIDGMPARLPADSPRVNTE